jgi:non-canonical purine NTP pyrophosphatase (RdgB/HAM1 family)
LAEYAQLLNMPMLTLCSLRDVDISADAPEDGTTFVANALQKARYYAAKSGLPTLADDSGIVVDALAGAPGVYSARYGTPDLDDTGRRRLLLANVNALGDVVRSARFVCVIALVLPDGREFHTQGICEGQIAMHEAGDGRHQPSWTSHTCHARYPATPRIVMHNTMAAHGSILFLRKKSPPGRRTYARPHPRGHHARAGLRAMWMPQAPSKSATDSR